MYNNFVTTVFRPSNRNRILAHPLVQINRFTIPSSCQVLERFEDPKFGVDTTNCECDESVLFSLRLFPSSVLCDIGNTMLE